MEDWGEPGEDVVAPTSIEVQDIKLFGKWPLDEVQVVDISLTVSSQDTQLLVVYFQFYIFYDI